MDKRLILLGFVLLLLTNAHAISPNPALESYYPDFSNWELYWRKITIDNILNTTLYDYPIKLVFLHPSIFKNETEFLTKTNYSGSVRFLNDNKTIPLESWMEGFYPDENVYWVKIPKLKANSTTYIYMYYGDYGNPDNPAYSCSGGEGMINLPTEECIGPFPNASRVFDYYLQYIDIEQGTYLHLPVDSSEYASGDYALLEGWIGYLPTYAINCYTPWFPSVAYPKKLLFGWGQSALYHFLNISSVGMVGNCFPDSRSGRSQNCGYGILSPEYMEYFNISNTTLHYVFSYTTFESSNHTTISGHIGNGTFGWTKYGVYVDNLGISHYLINEIDSADWLPSAPQIYHYLYLDTECSGGYDQDIRVRQYAQPDPSNYIKIGNEIKTYAPFVIIPPTPINVNMIMLIALLVMCFLLRKKEYAIVLTVFLVGFWLLGIFVVGLLTLVMILAIIYLLWQRGYNG